jgi:monomeric sarcosine oxidase
VRPRLLVIGGGVMGAATTYYAKQMKANVKVLAPGGVNNPLAASSDYQRAFRFSYAADRKYVALAKAALPLWRDIERAWGQPLLDLSGMLFLGHGDSSYAMQSYRTLSEMGEAVELLTPAQVTARWPQFNADVLELGVLDHNGGFVAAQEAVSAMARLAQWHTTTIIRERAISIKERNGEVRVRTADGGVHLADAVVVAVNGWVNKLLGVNYVTNTQQPVMYYSVAGTQHSYTPANFPVFADLDRGYYGFPSYTLDAVKVANHGKGQPIDPDARGELSQAAVDDMRGWLAQFIPELANQPIVHSRVCFYDNSPDDDFIIDRLPGSERIVVACGFSGHGFKFAPIIGKTLATLALTGEQLIPLEPFRISRLAAANG